MCNNLIMVTVKSEKNSTQTLNYLERQDNRISIIWINKVILNLNYMGGWVYQKHTLIIVFVFIGVDDIIVVFCV